jgi:hypothetical protein
MQKVHTCEAILLMTRGVDDVVRGLERVKRDKDSGLDSAYFDEKPTLFNVYRALLNGCCCNNIEGSERRDKARFAKRHGEHEQKMLDEAQVYQDVQATEECRRQEGKALNARILSEAEKRDLERQPIKSQRRGENDYA